MFTITLLAQDIAWCKQEAQKTLDRFKETSGHYDNTENSHYIGKLGEMAVFRYLQGEPHKVLIPYFADEREVGKCDILSENMRIEVKTWSARHWPQLGRCVREEQLPTIRAKADTIFWCYVLENHDEASATVVIAGQNTIKDIANAPIRETGRQKLANHQLSLWEMRPVHKVH